jgi:hypothetical protein
MKVAVEQDRALERVDRFWVSYPRETQDHDDYNNASQFKVHLQGKYEGTYSFITKKSNKR